MAESISHKRAKEAAAGRAGRTEAPLGDGRRIDAVTRRRATEVERSGCMEQLEKAARRLKSSGKSQKVLQVPHHDMVKAAKAMRKVGVSGTVKNMGGTKRLSVKGKK